MKHFIYITSKCQLKCECTNFSSFGFTKETVCALKCMGAFFKFNFSLTSIFSLEEEKKTKFMKMHSTLFIFDNFSDPYLCLLVKGNFFYQHRVTNFLFFLVFFSILFFSFSFPFCSISLLCITYNDASIITAAKINYHLLLFTTC